MPSKFRLQIEAAANAATSDDEMSSSSPTIAKCTLENGLWIQLRKLHNNTEITFCCKMFCCKKQDWTKTRNNCKQSCILSSRMPLWSCRMHQSDAWQEITNWIQNLAAWVLQAKLVVRSAPILNQKRSFAAWITWTHTQTQTPSQGTSTRKNSQPLQDLELEKSSGTLPNKGPLYGTERATIWNGNFAMSKLHSSLWTNH